jgi:hypothetical protein
MSDDDEFIIARKEVRNLSLSLSCFHFLITKLLLHLPMQQPLLLCDNVFKERVECTVCGLLTVGAGGVLLRRGGESAVLRL